MSSKFTFNDHSNLVGQHALFSPSQGSWLRYEDDKVAERVLTQYRAPIGTEIHEFAAMQIKLNHRVTNIKTMVNDIENYIYTKYTFLSNDLTISDYGTKLINNTRLLPREVFDAVRYYINDGIGFKMTTEQPLVYSDHIFGTADSIVFRDNKLHIHDLKTGAKAADMEQLEIYAALFCLEYGPKYNFKPGTISMELRIYQWDGISIYEPTADEIVPIMDKIISTEKIAYNIEKEE